MMNPVAWKCLAALTLAPALLHTPVLAKAPDYFGSVQTVVGEAAPSRASGTVFLDINRNSLMDEGEQGIAGVLVSNGREVVTTDSTGAYSLPAYDDMNLFITKPRGYASPVSTDMVPQFYYVHKVEGSPPLRYGGIAATGPLPQKINFPLIKDDVGDSFQCLVFGDVQAYTNQEVGFVRETMGRMLASRDNSKTECLLFEGDVAGDDLTLYPRLKQIGALGGVPQYWVAGNHDLDFDAMDDQHSFDTFRREWGPEYYSFDIGQVHFVVLDNVRYPCNGIDDHPFCAPDGRTSYNGVISDRQLNWLENDLAKTPDDKLIVVNTHIPLVAYVDADQAKHQTDNLDALYDILKGRRVLGLSGHTHTTEQILPGDYYEGWEMHTNTGPAQFHQIVTGAISASWWAGDLNDAGVPHGTQRLGSPRGYYQLFFDGADYVDTYLTFDRPETSQLHASFNTPRFRNWAEDLLAYIDLYGVPSDVTPPVTVTDLGDVNMITQADLAGGSWVAVNVWNGSTDSKVTVSLNKGSPMAAKRTQEARGEPKREGVEYADPLAFIRQSTNGRIAFQSVRGGEDTDGFTTWKGVKWSGVPGPFMKWMMTTKSNHLWRFDLPSTLPEGMHTLDVETVDRYGRTFSHALAFEVVAKMPQMTWNKTGWE